MADYITDLSQIANSQAGKTVKVQHSTSRKDNANELDMTDFLVLMVTQLQNQTIDDTMDTSQMLDQFVQISNIQAINDISALIKDNTTMTYAASLVGKEIVVGQWLGNKLVEKSGIVKGTGTLNGEQVIFLEDDSCFKLNEIMAVGKLPEDMSEVKLANDQDKDGDGKKTNAVR